MDVNELQTVVTYILQNQDDLEKIIGEFGEVTNDNGYGTIFLKPKNSLFKVFWIYQQSNKVRSIGFGGPDLGLTVKDLYSYYKGYKESYNHHDDEYVYIFSSPNYPTHTIRVSSSNRLMEGENIISNKDVSGIDIDIILRNE